MDLAQAFIFAVGWVFFATWGACLAALSVIAFGWEIFPFVQRLAGEKNRH
jgi:hypothetical protein